MLDVTTLLKETWNLVSIEKTVRHWLKSLYLSHRLQVEINQQYRMRNLDSSNRIEE